MVTFFLGAAAATVFVGCGTSDSPTAAPTGAPFKSFVVFYDQYLKSNKNQPPASEQVYRQFLESKEDELAAASLTVDQMFKSPRNGAPLTWVYGKKPPTGGYGETYVAYETTPVNGRTTVFGLHGTQVEMDEAWFRSVFR